MEQNQYYLVRLPSQFPLQPFVNQPMGRRERRRVTLDPTDFPKMFNQIFPTLGTEVLTWKLSMPVPMVCT